MIPYEIMYGRLTRLRHTYRYSSVPVQNQENVAEHGYWTAMIGVGIALEVEPGNKALWQDVALRALLHDVEECMTGDIVREMKYHDAEFREAVYKVESDFARRIFDDMGDRAAPLHEIWRWSKDDTELAGSIVALADLLCVIAYCDMEIEFGNHNQVLRQIRADCRQLIVTKFFEDADLKWVAREVMAHAGR